jgi:hypothetical protein
MERTARTGQPGHYNRIWIARTDQLEWTARTGQPGKESQDRTTRTGKLGQDKNIKT